ncbi:histidine kinase dimerization/phosphoacceptor domain -containing protein [Thalassospira sp.]|uniref:sensor histidine kinase n=1 Tax=Thalassospira sp. TaxID=1912094 RepID=UPI000C5909E4|nr:histidine kinase dimerization/phosphoacceptor domain -containing protein [Thalassospira sp.]MBC05931.1 histidine kinase [Thalassospira sp.]|tara:strand:- start:8059 stop:9117 length:1059 start_codon:yes stop_codon:yes gene_type:complete
MSFGETGAQITEHAFPTGSPDQRFERVVEYAPNAMILIGTDGTMEMVNAQTEIIFGYARSELLGQPIEMLVPERFRAGHPNLRGSYTNHPNPRPMGAGRDLYALRKDGSEFPVEIGLNPISDGENMQILAAISDISERKHREEQIARSLREKETLLSEVHHRVKNNLQIIHSLLDMQTSSVIDVQAREALIDSCNRVRSMAQIHQSLYQSEDIAKVNFADFCESLISSLLATFNVDITRVRVESNLADVQLAIDQAVPCGLIANELITNALKHGFPDGTEGQIEVSTKMIDADVVELRVSDNGRGMPDNFKLGTTEGLGLQLIELLVDQIGGDIDVLTDQDTTFVISFRIGS